VGRSWGETVALAAAPARMVDLAERFVRCRGDGPDAAWHVVELPEPLVAAVSADPRIPVAREALQFGPVPGGVHVPVGDAGIDRAWLDGATGWTGREADHEVILTPWKGVLVPTTTYEERR